MEQALTDHMLADLQAVAGGSDTKTARFIDVFFAYRLLLQRYPEFGDAESYQLHGASDLKTLVDGVMKSVEFQRLWVRKESWSPDAVVMTEHAGLRYFFNLRDRAIGLAIATGQFEPNMERLVRTLVKPGMCCIDVGANLGFFSVLMASLCGPEGQVVSLEPFPEAFSLLLRNIRENHLENTVAPLQLAAHETNNQAAMCYRADESNDNFGSMFVPHTNSKLRSSHATVNIQCQRLDDLIKNGQGTRVDLVKIDVEGSEPYALRGMKRILLEQRPIILIELNEYCLVNMGCSSAEEVMVLIEEYGYVPHDVDLFLNGQMTPYKFQKQDGRFEFHNLICIPSPN